ncbi:MAG: hypothetical protein ACREHD_28460 [Pirellulales bacterium]
MDQIGTRIAKAFVGAIAGAVVALLSVLVFDRREPPISIRSIVLPLAFGGVAGSVVAVLVGNRHVSVFWLYLAVIFGLITVMPWWYNPMTRSYLPLGAIYVNPAPAERIALVVALHSFVSVFLATGLAVLTGAPRFQFSLKMVFAVTAAICLVLALSHWIGR